MRKRMRTCRQAPRGSLFFLAGFEAGRYNYPERKNGRSEQRRLDQVRRTFRHFGIAAALALALVMIAAAPVMTPGPSAYRAYAEGGGELDAGMDPQLISRFGNIRLIRDGRHVTQDDFEDAGIEYGDIVTVSFLDQQMDLPVVKSYSEVGIGDRLLRVDGEETELAVNMGDFASEYVADKSTFEDQSFVWTYKKGISDVTFRFVLKTKGGLYAEYGHESLTYPDERSAFPDLSDEQFANFRVIATTGMGKDILYRTATPIDPSRNRSTYADEACKKHGIATIMNLSDSEETAKSYPGYGKTYYSTTDYIPLCMGVDFDSDDFRGKLAEGLRYFAEHKGPYAVHCTEGKDRAGLVAALLECLMGAEYDEVVSDYMVSYYNYYGITPDDERYDEIVSDNIEKTLKTMFRTDDLKNADLAAEAEEYCREIGLTDGEIEALKAGLGGKKTDPAGPAVSADAPAAVLIAALAAVLIAVAVFRRKKSGSRH